MRLISLTQGYSAKVDDADFAWLSQHAWSAKVIRRTPTSEPHVSAVRTEHFPGGRRQIYMHRLIMGAGPDQAVDHANRDALDNQRANLRFCDSVGNAANRVYPSGGLGYRGVRKSGGRFRAQIRLNGAVRQSQSFDTAPEAARAYDDLARQLHGEFAVLNFPEHAASPE